MTAAPAPLTPADCDLRGLPSMLIDFPRVFDSDTYALTTGDEFKACFSLWGRAWSQVPAGSVPNDERIIARLAGVNLTDWRAMSATVLRGWRLCADNRWYHPIVSERALEAFLDRLKHRRKGVSGNAKRHSAYDPDAEYAAIDASAARALTCLRALNPLSQRLSKSIGADEADGGAAATASENARSSEKPLSQRRAKNFRTEKNRIEGIESASLPSCLAARPARPAELKLERLCGGFEDVVSSDIDDAEWRQDIERLEAEGFDFERDILPGAAAFFRSHRRRANTDATWMPVRALHHPGIIERIRRQRDGKQKRNGKRRRSTPHINGATTP